MRQIYRVYGVGDVPKFGPEEHHPDCQRWTFFGRFVDAVGEPTEAEVLALIGPKSVLLPDLRARRDMAINVLDGLQADALASSDTPTALAIKDAKQACRDLPALDVSSATDEAGVRALYLAEWRRITLMVPAGVRTAFAKALA